MRGLTVIVATDDADRFGAAISIANAAAALGARTRLYLHDKAVALLATADLADAFALDVRVIACQTGLAGAGLDLTMLNPAISAGGLISLMADLGDDRLVTV